MTCRTKAMEDFEDGEPWRGQGRRRFAEHLSVYAKSGPESEVERFPIRRNAYLHRADGLSAEELAEVERVWARLPRFDDLVRGRA